MPPASGCVTENAIAFGNPGPARLERCRVAARIRYPRKTTTWRWAPENGASAQAVLHVLRSDCQQGTEQLSTTARDQSIWSRRASQSRSAKWIKSHTPACCQSRTRRQHVIPDPHPSSCGSICHGMPLRRTNRIPVRHARSGTRGRPPFGRWGGAGKNGSTRSHNGTGSSAAAIRVHVSSPTRFSVRRFCYALLVTLGALGGAHLVGVDAHDDEEVRQREGDGNRPPEQRDPPLGLSA